MKVVIVNGRVIRMSKGIPREEFSGTYLGITVFSREIQQRLFATLGSLILAGRVNDFFNIAVQRLADERVTVAPSLTRGWSGLRLTTSAISPSTGNMSFQNSGRHRGNLGEIINGRYSSGWSLWPPRSIGVVDWNTERGRRLPAVLDFLAELKPDLLTLQEVDLNARRTHGLPIAEEIARALSMDFVFAPEFQELAEGTRTSPAFTGQATLCRWPLSNPRVIRFRRQSDFWHPRWYVPNVSLFQERLGGRIALAVEARVGGKVLAIYNTHLESRGPDHLRLS